MNKNEPLRVAISATRPLETDPVPLAVERLHQRQESLHRNDEGLADPIRDHLPQQAPQRKVRRLMSILDSLDENDSETTNRRFNH